MRLLFAFMLGISVVLATAPPSSSAAAIGGDFVDNGDGTVTQTKDYLMWQRGEDGATRTLGEATSYCQALSLGKYSDWHLPDEHELLFSLWAGAASNKTARDLFFPNAQSTSGLWYLSSPGVYSYLTWPDTGTMANEHTGYANGTAEKIKRYVLCVRTAK